MVRPAKYERAEVIEKAMHVFWDRGYCATSMARLLGETGLKPGSLYAAFDSKDALFLAALDLYAERSAQRVRLALTGGDSPLEAVCAYFTGLGNEATGKAARRGCLLVNTALEQGRLDDRVRGRVGRHFDTIEALFRDALAAAARAGELPEGKDPAVLAAFLMSNIWGLRVLGMTRAKPARVRAVVDQVLSVLRDSRV